MKAILRFVQSINQPWLKILLPLLIFMLFIIIPSCQKFKDDFAGRKIPEMSNLTLTSEFQTDCLSGRMSLYFGHKIIKRRYGTPFTEKIKIENPDFSCYAGNFVLKIRNGCERRARVSSAEIRIDGVLLVSHSDFSKNVTLITKQISGLTPESILEVKLNSAPGSYIDLWIEGIKNNITPTFEKIGPVCQTGIAPTLPLSSINTPAITGKWNPTTISTATTGKSIYTFTPSEGQCASSVTMEIEVTTPLTPAFTEIGPFFLNSVAPGLPPISNNGITGTWNPETINTGTPGTFTFTFTPAAGQCATTLTIPVEIKNSGVADVEGNEYGTVKIGDQWWMTENLKTTKYNNGELINTTTPATLNILYENESKYQWAFGGNESNVATFGRLYTWYSVTDSRGICPLTWHVPTDAEWTSLTDYLINNNFGYGGGGPDIAKSLAAISGWNANATPGNIGNDQVNNNSSGFTALPDGDRMPGGTFELIGIYAGFWSSSESSATNAWYRGLYNNLNYVIRDNANKKYGGAIRCVKDN